MASLDNLHTSCSGSFRRFTFGSSFFLKGICAMYFAFAIVIVVCSLAIVGLAMFSTDKAQAAWGVVGIVIALQVWFFDRGRRKRLELYAQAEAQRATRRTNYTPTVPTTCKFDEILAVAERNLSLSRFVISHNVVLPNSDSTDLVASGIESLLLGGTGPSVVQHLLLKHLRIATADDFEKLFEGGYRYVKRTRHNSFLRRSRVMHVILPCIAVDTAAPELIAFAKARPPKRWMRFEFPVLYDLSTGLAYYHEKTPALGSMFFPGARALADLAFDIQRPSTAI